MSEELSIKHQSLIYKAQRSILAYGKDVKAILEVLGKLSYQLFEKEGFAVLSYDFAAQISVRTYIISAVITFVLTYVTTKFLSRKVKSIDMVSSLKGNE